MSKIPSGIELPNRKKQGPVAVDLMRPGNGTPWEDRGSSGAIPAYFKTAFKSFTSPGLLMDHIRRPETTSDAKRFALVSAVMWFVGLLLWNVYWLLFVLPVQTGFLRMGGLHRSNELLGQRVRRGCGGAAGNMALDHGRAEIVPIAGRGGVIGRFAHASSTTASPTAWGRAFWR